METSTSKRAEKSTIGRSFLRVAAQVAPSAVIAASLKAFFRPSRPAPRDPAAPGLTAHRWTFDTGRDALPVWEWGEGPTVLFIHGWGGQAADFRHFIAPLVYAGYSVAAFDAPAHGRATGVETTLLEHAHAAESLGRRLGPLEAVVGHSFGGAAAALALANGLPARRGVLLASPVEMQHFATSFANQIGLPERSRAGWYAAVERKVGVPMASVDLRNVAARASAPLLVVHDEHDKEIPVAHGQAIAAAWPGARLHRTVGLGHRRILADAGVVELVVREVAGEREVRRSA